MSSIDDLFRKPNAPPKRKLEDPSTSFTQHYRQQNKAPKLSNGSSPHGEHINGSQAIPAGGDDVTKLTQDGAADLQDDDDVEAGPSLPPEDADDEPGDDDEEGRFFGGGVSKQEKQVLDFIDQNTAGETEEKIDTAWLKKTTIAFERKINKNAELRAKYEDEPLKFVGSEADLDAEIKNLSLLSEHGELYSDFVKMGCAGSLVSLLAHENTDIAIAVCELMAELTDEDSAAEGEQWQALVDAMIQADVVDLLVSNLSRLDEVNENDRAGVYHVLSVMENMLSDIKTAVVFGNNAKLLQWLRTRIQTPDPESRAKVGQNRQYAAEMLAILLQGSDDNKTRFAEADGVDALLQLLSAYRKRDPERDSDEEEFVENLFDCLVSVVKCDQGVTKFLDGEGMELCLIMLREGKLSKARALRVIDHALGGEQAALVGARLVEAAGLKTVFSMFMKAKKQDRETTEHIIGIFASLLRFLPAESAARIRTLAKFVEKNYEKITRLVELRKEYQSRVAIVDGQIKKEREGLDQEAMEDLEAEFLSRRFDAGLFSLQTLDVVLAWLVAEDDGARTHISSSFGGLDILRQSLQDQLVGLDPDEGKDVKDMLEALLQCFS